MTKIPAITRVHECSRLDTGVGPSIASGNQSHVVATTDLNEAITSNPVTANAVPDVSVLNPGKTQSDVATTVASSTSPTRLKPIAENEEELARDRLFHVEISEKLTIPTISHPSRRAKLVETPTLTTNQTVSRKLHSVKANLHQYRSNSR